MTDLIFTDEDGSFKAIFRTDLLKGNDGIFTVMDIQGLEDAEKATGLDFSLEENDLGTFINYAQNNNLQLERNDGENSEILVASPGAFNIVTTTLPDGNNGVAYSEQLAVENEIGDVTYAISAGALPSGLSLNEETGEISGTPDTTETANFDVTATDEGDNSDTQSLSITINA